MHDVSLGVDDETGELVLLGLTERRQGLYVIGKNGMGKTTLLEHLIVQDIEAGLGLCVLDPHGDLVDAVLARMPVEREHDVILLDLADSSYPFGLNLFECADTSNRSLVGRVAAQAVEVFEKLWGDVSWGPQLAQVLRNCAYTMVENQGFTMAELRRLLLDEGFRAQLVDNVDNPQVAGFWKLEYDPLRPQDRQQIVRSTLNKVDEFLTPTVYPIVGFGRTTVDFRKVMDDGKIVLVQLKAGPIGSKPAGLIGSILVGQILNAALSRQDLPPAERRQFHLYADEYQRFATPAFGELLAEARKYAVATTLAHQYRSQLPDAANRGATLNAGNMVVFGVTGEDADELAKQFDRTPPAPAVSGQRPKLSISQAPVEHLSRAAHSNQRVSDLVAQHLKPWVDVARTMSPDDIADRQLNVVRVGVTDSGMVRPGVSRTVVEHGLQAVNTYLSELMNGRVLPRSSEAADLLTNALLTLPQLMGVTHHSYFEWADSLWNSRRYDIRNGKASELILRVVNSAPRTKESLRAYVALLEPLLGSNKLVGSTSFFQGTENGFSGWLERSGNLADALRSNFWGSTVEVPLVDLALVWLGELAQLLVEEPILVDSGQWEPIYERPRSYSDIEAEIASTLVSLPVFRARCRLIGPDGVREHTLRTPRFDQSKRGYGNQEMVDRIRNRTRNEYCAPLDEVLTDIQKRQMGDDPPSASSIERRVPLK